MSDHEFLSIHLHSRTHPRLSDQPIEKARNEITESRIDLEDILDVTADIFYSLMMPIPKPTYTP
jgi:hypothetical protein